MKTINFKSLVIFLVLTGFCTGAMAQEKTKTDQERREELLRAIEDQKKVLNEQQKEQAQTEKELEDKMEEIRKEFNEDVNVDENNNGSGRRGSRPPNFPDRFYQGAPNMPNMPNVPNTPMPIFSFGEDVQRTTWEFSKSVKNNSFKREYVFDVENSARSISISLNGDCKSGEIKVKIVAPGGKTYSEDTMNQNVSINVRRSVNISETENEDKKGEWKFIIESNNATGYFRIYFQTF